MTKVTSPERCLIVGAPADTARIVYKLESSPGVSAVVVGRAPLRFDERAARQHAGNGSPLAMARTSRSSSSPTRSSE